MSLDSQKPAQKVTYLGKVDYRNKELTFGIKEKDRTRHMYVIGKTGMGKSTLLENMAVQDILNGEGVCVIDPHGSMAEKLLEYIPKERIDDVIYFAPFDTEYPLGLNVLEQVDFSKRHLVANGLMSAFKKIFGEDRFSDRIQYILNNIILSLLECEGESLLGVNRMLNDKEYRKYVISQIKDPSVRSFWLEEYAKAGEKYQQEAAPGIQNKIGQFISNPLIRNIIGQKETAFDIREVMDNKKILIVNLSKGKVGEGNANLIGSLLITKIYLAAMSRADAGVHALESLPPFYFYVDEFQNFANDSFANILSEARKYNLALTVAHQYIEQMTDEVKAAVFGNVGTMITFRVGATDAEAFEKEFAPYFTMDDIVNLSAFQVYLRLMIDGVGSKPFSAQMLPPIKKPEISYAEEIIENSRRKYAKKLSLAEEEVRAWYEPKIIATEKVENKGEVTPQAKGQKPEFKDARPRYDTPRRDERRDDGGAAPRFEQKKSPQNGSGNGGDGKRHERQLGFSQNPHVPPVAAVIPAAVAVTAAALSASELASEKVEVVTQALVPQESKPLSQKKEEGMSLAERIRQAQKEVVDQGGQKTQEVISQEKKEEASRKEREEVMFDGAKPSSLKEALLKAMKEKEASSEALPQVMVEHEKQAPLHHSKPETKQEEIVAKEDGEKSGVQDAHTSHAHGTSTQDTTRPQSTVREVSEDVLNPLIKDEEIDTLLRNEE